MQNQGLKFIVKKYFAAAIVLAFAIIAISGAHLGMEKMDNGKMAGCPFMAGSSALCQMSATEHIQAWQAMFAAIPQKVFGSFLTLLLLSVVVLSTLVTYWRRQLSSLQLFELSRLYIKEHSHLSFFDPLKEAFSQGILNPRIYA